MSMGTLVGGERTVQIVKSDSAIPIIVPESTLMKKLPNFHHTEWPLAKSEITLGEFLDLNPVIEIPDTLTREVKYCGLHKDNALKIFPELKQI